MNLVLLSRFPITTVTGSNSRSHRLISRTWRHILDLRARKTVVKTASYVERFVPRPVARLLAPVCDAALAANRGIRRRRRSSAMTIRELSRFDDSADRLSHDCETTGRIIVRRTAGYLNWRFARNPRCRYRLLGGFFNGRLVGYVVFRLNLARGNPEHQGEIVDWLALPVSGIGFDPLPRLIGAAIERLARDGAHVVACLSSDGVAKEALTANQLIERPTERLPFFVHADAPTLETRLEQAGDWYLTGGDFDVE
jgi:hypothetical protein